MCCLQYKQIRVDDDDMMIICNKFDFIMLCALIYMNSVIILPNTIYCSIEHALTALFVIVASYTRRPIIFEQLVESQSHSFQYRKKFLQESHAKRHRGFGRGYVWLGMAIKYLFFFRALFNSDLGINSDITTDDGNYR